MGASPLPARGPFPPYPATVGDLLLQVQGGDILKGSLFRHSAYPKALQVAACAARAGEFDSINELAQAVKEHFNAIVMLVSPPSPGPRFPDLPCPPWDGGPAVERTYPRTRS